MKIKQYFTRIGLIACTAGLCLPAIAQIGVNMEQPCRVYEFGELKTFSDSELKSMEHEYKTIAKNIGNGPPPETPLEVDQDFGAIKNCTDEAGRIERILASRSGKGDDQSTSQATPQHKRKSKAH
jgi:hypothetical protein